MSGFSSIIPVPNANLATMAQTTVKGLALADGGGSPLDLTAAQIAAIVGSVGGAIKSAVLSTTRDLTAAGAPTSVAYTGVGFTPTALIGFGSVGVNLNNVCLIGIADSAKTGRTIALGTTLVNASPRFMLFGDSAPNNYQIADVASYDADGFTLSWTKVGTPSGTATIYVLCLR